jgi:hypothetical protein
MVLPRSNEFTATGENVCKLHENVGSYLGVGLKVSIAAGKALKIL